VQITKFDRQNFRIEARAAGEEFTIGKHTQGAEVKAITYSAMQIHDRPEVARPELFVIVDI
jgi:SHS2 domain-containing protein